jgi:putative DNA primase/helicase
MNPRANLSALRAGVCPLCGRSPSPDGSGFSITAAPDGRRLWYCFTCQTGGATRDRSVKPTPNAPPARAPRLRGAGLDEKCAALWARAADIEVRHGFASICENAALDYLTARVCAIPPPGSHLRWLPRAWHSPAYAGPALIALVTDAITGAPLNIHRTWIKADGTKADVEPPRRLAGGHAKKGGVIRLQPLVDDTLVVAEGIETALSVALSMPCVWSTIDAGNLGDLPVLSGVRTLVIAADNDPTGLKAARDCERRWKAAGRHVSIQAPPTPGEDWNDCAIRHRDAQSTCEKQT